MTTALDHLRRMAQVHGVDPDREAALLAEIHVLENRLAGAQATLRRVLDCPRPAVIVTCDGRCGDFVALGVELEEATLVESLRAAQWTVTEREYRCPRCKP